MVLEKQNVPLSLTLPGRTTAFETSEVRPQVSGIIQARLFTEGAIVKEGTLLYRIDPRLYESALTQARADLASAIATRKAARTRAERWANWQIRGGQQAGPARRTGHCRCGRRSH